MKGIIDVLNVYSQMHPKRLDPKSNANKGG